MSEPMESALTAEEWQWMLEGEGIDISGLEIEFGVTIFEADEVTSEPVLEHYNSDLGGSPMVRLQGLLVEDGSSPTSIGLVSQRHALAALCLYGQPFGFTREDLQLLREEVEPAACDRAVYPEEHERVSKEFAHLRNLADRIAALLPPEEGRKG